MGRWLNKVGMLFLLGGVGWLLLVTPVDANDNDTDGYLSNGGFEGNYYAVDDELVAEGWTRHHLEGTPDWMSTQVFANGGWVEKIAGENSHILSVDNLGIGEPFKSVLSQQVHGLAPGQPYSFSGWILKMWGGSANQIPPADPYSFGSRVGIDPTGGTDPTSSNIIWSEYHWETRVGSHPQDPAKFNDQWVAAIAENSTITVFVEVWLKWQKAESQAIVDAMELFDAPVAILHTPSGAVLQEPYLEWSGTLPQSLLARGAFELFYLVQKREGDGWVTIAERLQDDNTPLPLEYGRTVELRVVPYSFQVASWGVWPPTTHIGMPTDPILVSYGVVDSTSPVAWLGPPLRWQPVEPFPVYWAATDEGTGVAAFDVEYRRVGAASWNPWKTGTTAWNGTFGEEGRPEVLAGGDEWEFRVRARDGAGNVGEWSPPVRTGLTTSTLWGRLLSANGHPVPNAHITVDPYPFSELPPVEPDGSYMIPLGTAEPYTLNFLDGAGNHRLPPTVVQSHGPPFEMNWYLDPPDNAVINGHFEETDSGWSGEWSRILPGNSGVYEALLAAGSAISQTVEVVEGQGLSMLIRPESTGGELTVTLGDESWSIPVDSPTRWYQVVESQGTLTLTLEVTGSALRVDEVTLGTPQAPPRRVYLPLKVIPAE